MFTTVDVMDIPQNQGTINEAGPYYYFNQNTYLDNTNLNYFIPQNSGYEDITDDDASSSDSGIVCQKLPTSVAEWNSDQIMKWILELYDSADYRYEDLNLHYFKQRNGVFLMNLKEKDWEKIDKKRGNFLFENVQRLLRESFTTYINNNHESSSRVSVISYTPSCSQSSGYNSGTQSSDEDELPTVYVRRRGRPRSAIARRRNTQRLGRVWEFLRDLLLNPNYCPRIICWEDYESKIFRLVDGNEIAKLWGIKKNNPNMNYGKFSRSIRHYYKLKVIESVSGRRYVYKFGENAEGCETNNPNFGITM